MLSEFPIDILLIIAYYLEDDIWKIRANKKLNMFYKKYSGELSMKYLKDLNIFTIMPDSVDYLTYRRIKYYYKQYVTPDYIIIKSCERGHLDVTYLILSLLIKNNRVPLMSKLAFCRIFTFGNSKIVKTLLDLPDYKINTDMYKFAIMCSEKTNNIQVLSLLLQDNRFILDNNIFVKAMNHGHTEFAMMLLYKDYQ